MSSPDEGRVDRWLSRPIAPVFGVLVGVLLALPSVTIGFYADDDALLSFLEKRIPLAPPWYDLYRFAPDDAAGMASSIARGFVPWWTAPGLRLHLVRPLASALFAADHALFALWPLGYHLHSIAWWVVLLVSLGALYRQVLPAETAALGVLIFAVSDAHVFPYAWIAARHGLIAAVPVVLGLIATVRARQGGFAPGRWLAPLAMTVGLAGGEAALGGLAFWVSYELLGPSRAPDWGARLKRAAVPIAIGLAYLALYSALHGGARASGVYVDPTSPGLFALATAKRYPALLAAAFLHVPAELATVLPAAPFVLMAALGGAGAVLLWRACAPLASEAERSAVRWLVPGALATTFGAVGGFPGSREILLANIAWAALFAILVRHGLRAGRRPLVRRVGAALVLLIHVVLAPLVALGDTLNTARIARDVASIAHHPVLADGPSDRLVLVANASDPMTFLYPIALLVREGEAERSPDACYVLLSAVKGDVRITRTGAATLEIEPVSGSMLSGPFETLYRAPRLPFHSGDTVRGCGATLVRVLATDADGKPTRIEAAARMSLDDPRARVIAWKEGALRPLRLAVGERQELPWTPGPIGFF